MSAHKIRQKTKLYLSIAVCLHAVVIYTHTVRESERFYSRWLYSGSAKLKIFFSRIHDSVRCARSAWSWPIYRDCVQFSCKIFLPFSLHIFFHSHFLSYTHTHTLSQFRSIEFILTRTQRQSRIQIYTHPHTYASSSQGKRTGQLYLLVHFYCIVKVAQCVKKILNFILLTSDPTTKAKKVKNHNNNKFVRFILNFCASSNPKFCWK